MSKDGNYQARPAELLLMDQIASDAVLEEACAWLRAARADAHPNDDVWHLLHWWSVQKSGIQQELRAGAYRFEALRRVQGREQVFELWSARDALVLKAMSLVLTRYLAPNLSRRCFHLAGTGGLKGAIREVQRRLPDHTFVFRTDVKGYYASINHELLFEQVRRLVPDRRVLNLVWQYMERWIRNGGNYTAVHCGIALGCPLSPLMGALYLKPLDDKMAALGCCYVRYMDDWVVMSPKRWKLREAIRAVNEVMDALRVEQHPDKTFIGRISHGFDFLGYHFSEHDLALARQTVQRCAERISRLYEQGADALRIGEYLKRWARWVRSGLDGRTIGMTAHGVYNNWAKKHFNDF